MRGFLILFVVLAVLTVMMPFILSFVAFLVLFAAVFFLLARFGLLPGASFKTYTYTSRSRQGERTVKEKHTVYFGDDEVPPAQDSDGWYQSTQEGETITLPETALKKDDGESPSS